MFNGKFFHRDELVRPETNDYTKRMQDALEAHREHAANGTLPRRGKKGSAAWQTDIWHLYGVKKASFYKALKWEAEHPGRAWSGANIRLRGKITLLTESMEEELQHWIALSQRQSGGVEKDVVCRVGFALMASDPEHYSLVQAQHPEYQNLKWRAFSGEWFQKFRKKFPDLLRRHKAEAYAVGRAQVTREMVDSIYDVLQVVLAEANELIPATHVWNFDETGTKVQYARTFLYGLSGSQGNQAESMGAGEHVTIGATANINGDHLDPVFFCGSRGIEIEVDNTIEKSRV